MTFALEHSISRHQLSRRGFCSEEKRRGVEALGAEMIGKLSYYERWIAVFANILFQKGILTPGELARKMEEVEARWSPDPAGESAETGASP